MPEGRGGWFYKTNLLTSTTPALRATPPQLQGSSRTLQFIHTFIDRAYSRKCLVLFITFCAARKPHPQKLTLNDGCNVRMAYRFAEGRFERLPTLADAWVRLPVDVRVTDGTGVLAARPATDTIPIVFADPRAEGLVGSPDAGWLVITPVLNPDA